METRHGNYSTWKPDETKNNMQVQYITEHHRSERWTNVNGQFIHIPLNVHLCLVCAFFLKMLHESILMLIILNLNKFYVPFFCNILVLFCILNVILVLVNLIIQLKLFHLVSKATFIIFFYLLL